MIKKELRDVNSNIRLKRYIRKIRKACQKSNYQDSSQSNDECFIISQFMSLNRRVEICMGEGKSDILKSAKTLVRNIFNDWCVLE
jgi:hypothetical protein